MATVGGGGGGVGGGGGGLSRRRHHGEQRSGVPTVVEEGMDASQPHLGPSPPRLAVLRGLVPKVLIGHKPVIALEKLADSWLVSCPSSSTFGEECEVVIALLYTTLTIPNSATLLLPQDLVFTFLDRWVEDGGKMELCELMNFLKPEWKCGAAQVLFLLCANLMPVRWGQPVLQADVTSWKCEWLPNVAAPAWLLVALGSSGDLTDFITLLRVSASMRQGVSISQMELKDSYLGTLTRFLCAVSLYKQGNYSCCLDTLQDINFMACEEEMQAWVLHLRGLGLANLGKPRIALMKLNDAVDRSLASLPALYNIAQVFQSLGEQRVELEVLDLLVKSGGRKMKGPQVSLQSSLLALHHTPPEHLVTRAQYYLSCRYFQEKKFLEAAENLESLLDREIRVSRSCDSTARSLLKPEDTLPTLPTYSVLLVLAAMSYATTTSHQQTLRILGHQFTEKAIGGSTFYHDHPEDRMKVIVSAAGQVLCAEALKGLDQETEALKELIRLEQALWWVKGVSDSGHDSARKWETIILQIKTFLYKMLSEIHKTRGSLQNHHHYTRLAEQCLDVLGRCQANVIWQDLCPSNQPAMDVIYEYFKSWLDKDLP